MNPNPIKFKVCQYELQGLRDMIHIELKAMEKDIHRLKGSDYLVFKVLTDLDIKYVGKIRRGDPPSKKYDLTMDKAEAWVLFFHFNNRIEEYHPAKQLLGAFHQKLI